MDGDVFFAERYYLEGESAFLLENPEMAEVNRERFEGMLDNYAKLLRQTRRLVRLSDRAEERLKIANNFIENKKRELEDAHSKLSDHAENLDNTVKARTRELAEERVKLERLVRLGVSLASERDEDRLLELILEGAKDLSGADGGTLYIRGGDEGEMLRFEIVKNDSLRIHLGGTSGKEPDIPPVSLIDPETGGENHRNVASHAAIARASVNIPDAYESEEFDFSGTRKFDEITDYRSQSFLTVPLMPRGGEVIGALQLINSLDPDTGEVIPFRPEIQGFVEALAGQAAVAIDNQNLLEAQSALLDSFIELIASAIDAKSPYTGGHCARVPELAMMLTTEASEKESGPFSDFCFTTEDEWREFRIGAWLHDCGKVTTPEYVVDKATKLETIYNRIHEIRTRFEVLWRDAEIDYWKGMAENPADEAALKAKLENTHAALQIEFAFIAESNIGGEFMDDEKIQRINDIAGRTWTRHFGNRLGLSGAELKRYEGFPDDDVPCAEKLLDDKPDHVIPRDDPNPFEDDPFGIKMEVPPNLFNLGEVHNLTIRRGTLTDEERFKINDHIIQTIVMLGHLPFPKHLERVPEYAGAHHETMIGTGYPRKLKKEDMSVPARIMAIADIFEALTASDRPYKKAKKLSEALKIMNFMREDQHIDSDLFELFLETGVYAEYAERFLEPNQVDEVDVSQYLNGGKHG